MIKLDISYNGQALSQLLFNKLIFIGKHVLLLSVCLYNAKSSVSLLLIINCCVFSGNPNTETNLRH